MNYLDDLMKATGNDLAKSVEEGIIAGDVSDYIDTGSYMLNALVSGSIYKGLPSNKIVAFAGEKATGKTWYIVGLVKKFLDDNPSGGVYYFESESALTKEMLANRGIDIRRMFVLPVSTIQEFRTQSIKLLDKYLEREDKDQKIMICLDSLGMLSSTKEIEDTTAGLETKDMTKAQLIKATFRVLTLKLGRANVPMLVTNHVYANIGGGIYAGNMMSGGSGIQYAASSIVMLSKKKEKDGTEVIGNIIHCKNLKSRLTVENKVVDTLLTYSSGLKRYYGLTELAEKYGVFKKVGSRYELPDGTKVFGKSINKDPEKYFTEEILNQLDKCAAKEFLYGSDQSQESESSKKQPEETE
jgi:RecA/RadA recombinase